MMLIWICKTEKLWRWRGAVIVIILLYKALIKLPPVLSPAARSRIPLATSGISFTKKFSGLNRIWPSFSCQKFTGGKGGGVITLKVRMKVDVIDFDVNMFMKNEMRVRASFVWLHPSLSHQQSSQSFKLKGKHTWTGKKEKKKKICLKKPNDISILVHSGKMDPILFWCRLATNTKPDVGNSGCDAPMLSLFISDWSHL